MLPWGSVPQRSSTMASSQQGLTLGFTNSLCNPSVIPPAFKDTILIVLKSHKKERIRLPLTQQLSCSGTLRSKGFHFPSVRGTKPSLLQGRWSRSVAPFLQRDSFSEQRPSCVLYGKPPLAGVWSTPSYKPRHAQSSAFHRRKQDWWLQASLIILK